MFTALNGVRDHMNKRDNLSILHVTDLHFNRAACEWLAQNISVDVICISGDLFDDSVNAPLSCSEQAKWYRQFFQTLSVPIYTHGHSKC